MALCCFKRRRLALVPASRVSLVLIACCQCLIQAGIIYGWPALYQLLLDDKAYVELCHGKVDEDGTCADQRAFMRKCDTLVMSVGVCGALIYGQILDRGGPRITAVISSIMVAIGALLVGSASSSSNTLLAGLMLFLLFGPAIQNSLFSVSRLFPGRQGLITNLIVCSFTLSVNLFDVCHRLFLAHDVSRQSIFTVLAIALLCSATVSVFMWPDFAFSGPDSLRRVVQSVDSDDENPEVDLSPKPAPPTLKSQLFSWSFLAIVVWMTIGVFWSNLYYVRESDRIKRLGESLDQVETAKEMQSSMSSLMATGVVSVLCLGPILDRFGFVAGSSLATTVGILYTFVAFVKDLKLQFLRFVLFPQFRSMLFGVTWSFLGREFGYANYGMLGGILLTCTGIASFAGLPIVGFSKTHSASEVSSFDTQLRWVQLLFIAATLFFPIFLTIRDRHKNYQQVKAQSVIEIAQIDNLDDDDEQDQTFDADGLDEIEIGGL